MNDIQGTYRDGHVDLDRPVSWPNGSRVAVSQVSAGDIPATDLTTEWGIDDDWPDTPENRAEILRRMDAVEPLIMSPEEEAQWHATLDWFGGYTREAVRRDMGLAP